MGESCSEFFYFIPESIHFAEVTRISEDIKKTSIEATLKEINHLINNQKNLVDDPEKGDPVTPWKNLMEVLTN